MASKAQRFDTRQHMTRDTFEIFRYRDAYPKEVALHHHDFYEIYFFLSGNVQYNIESRTYLLAPGDVLLISPLELHQPAFGENRQLYERFVLWIDRTFLDNIRVPGCDFTACFNTSSRGRTNLLHFNGMERQLLTFQMEQLLEEAGSDKPFSQINALTYLTQILVQLNRQASLGMSRPSSPVAESTVSHVLAYINDHYSEDLSLDYLSNRFFISKYHLSREFNRLVGTSVHHYIILKRLVMAKQMMAAGMPSTEVYQHCGFGDYSNFYRAFRAEYEISPKQFAAQTKTARRPLPISQLIPDHAEK